MDHSQFRSKILMSFFSGVQHRFVKYCLCFLHTLFKNLNKSVQMFLCVLRKKTDPQSRLANPHNWVLNSVNMHPLVHHNTADQPGNNFVSDQHRHNSAWISNDSVTFWCENAFYVFVVLSHLLSPFSSLLVPEDVELSEWSCSLHWIDASSIRVGVAHVPHQLDQFFVFCSNETNISAESFWSCTTHDDIWKVIKSLYLPST